MSGSSIAASAVKKRRVGPRKGLTPTNYSTFGGGPLSSPNAKAGRLDLVAKAARPTPTAVPFALRRDTQCCWPLWGRRLPEAHGERFVCGATVGKRPGVGGEMVSDSYCEAHRAEARGTGTHAEREAA